MAPSTWARRVFSFIERIFADGGYAGQKMAVVVWRTGAWKLQIVKRSDAPGFEVYVRMDQPQSSPVP